jgi:molybdopterin converting factor small subunit
MLVLLRAKKAPKHEEGSKTTKGKESMRTEEKTVTVRYEQNGEKLEKELPYTKTVYETVDDVLNLLNAEDDKYEEKDENGNVVRVGSQTADDVTYAKDLRARNKVRQAFEASIISPDKAIAAAAKNIQKVFAAMGHPISEEAALKQAKAIAETAKASAA